MSVPREKKPIPRWVKVMALVGGLFFAALGFMIYLAAQPTDLEKLKGEIPAFVDDTRRVAREGCPLTDQLTDGACEALGAPTVVTEEVSFPTTTPGQGPEALKGTLHLPVFAASRARPAIVLVHGSGPATRDEKVPGDLLVRLSPPLLVFSELADHLAALGFVVLRYDKRSCLGCYPELDDEMLKGFSFLHFARDAEAALDYLATRPEVEAKSLIVVGHSQGAAFIPEIVEHRSDVVAAVWLAGFTGKFSEALLGQLDELGSIRARQNDYLSKWTVSASRAAIARCFHKLDDEDLEVNEVCIGGGVRQGALKEYEAHTATTRDRLHKLALPMLLVQGTLDRNVHKAELMALRETLKGDVSLRSLEGVGHALSEGTTSAISPQVSGALDAFLASVRR